MREAHRIGMCYWLLPESGTPIARSSVQPIIEEEMQDAVVIAALKAYGTDNPSESIIKGDTVCDQYDEEVAMSEPVDQEITMPKADD